MVKILRTSLLFLFYHECLTELLMVPECHLLVPIGRGSFGSQSAQVLLNRGSAVDKSHNLFTVCCVQVLLVVMLIFPNNLGLLVMLHWWSDMSR